MKVGWEEIRAGEAAFFFGEIRLIIVKSIYSDPGKAIGKQP